MSKLIEAPVKVKLWNGCYNVATCKVELSSTNTEKSCKAFYNCWNDIDDSIPF